MAQQILAESTRTRPENAPVVQDPGPSPYAMLRRQIINALQASGYQSLVHVVVVVRERMVSLSGAVTSWHLKQMAQQIVQHTAPGLRIQNTIEIATV